MQSHNNSTIRYCLHVILTVCWLGIISLLQRGIDFKKDAFHTVKQFDYMPSAPFLKVAAMEYKEVTADFIWLQAVQLIAKSRVGEYTGAHNLDWFYKTMDLVTDLDPLFSSAYQVGGVVLSVLSDDVDSSNILLNKGMRYNPTDWHLPFYLGFNYMYHLQDNLKAAQYMEKASQIEGHPVYLPLLTARLYTNGKDPQTALLFLKGVYLTTQDEKMREKLGERISELEKELDSKK